MSAISELQRTVERQKEVSKQLCEATDKLYQTLKRFAENIDKANERWEQKK